MRAHLRLPSPRLSSCVLAIAAGAALVASACGSSDQSVFPGGAGNDAGPDPYGGQNNGDGSFNVNFDSAFDPDALLYQDPAPSYCGPDAGGFVPPPPPSGTPACPSDKNNQGCPCTKEGETAACWPGHRRNRNVGICKDGQTICQKNGELQMTWGPCVGAVAPNPNGPTAADKCDCFSAGQWHIENLNPWFVDYTTASGDQWWGLSTHQGDGGASTPPTYPSTPPPSIPTDDWSKDDLTVDCSGTFTLCYELKGGDYKNPLPSDCSIAKVCLPSTFYPTPGAKQSFPVLPPWIADSSHSDCSKNFHANGGYGEMSVKGQTVACDNIDDGSGNSFVFHRIQYCPASNASCGQDGSGTFH